MEWWNDVIYAKKLRQLLVCYTLDQNMYSTDIPINQDLLIKITILIKICERFICFIGTLKKTCSPDFSELLAKFPWKSLLLINLHTCGLQFCFIEEFTPLLKLLYDPDLYNERVYFSQKLWVDFFYTCKSKTKKKFEVKPKDWNSSFLRKHILKFDCDRIPFRSSVGKKYTASQAWRKFYI